MASVLSISPFEQDSLAQQLGLSRAMAQNRALAMQNQYMPQMNQAKLALMNAQTQGAQAPKVTPLSNFQGLYNAWNQAPQGSQLKAGLGQMLNTIITPKSGLSVTQTPGGGFTVNQGVPILQNGQQQGIFSAPVQQASTRGQQGNGGIEMQNTGLGTNSRMSGGGAVYGDQSGNKMVTNNRQQQSLDLKQLAAIQRAVPQLQELVNVATKTQGAIPTVESKIGGWVNSLTQNTPFASNFKLPSEFAEKEARAMNIAESLINTFQLNANIPAVENFKKNVQPMSGESTNGYTKRIMGMVGDMLMMSDQGKSRLVNGTTIDKNGNIIVPDWAVKNNNSKSQDNSPSQSDIEQEIANRKKAGAWK